MIIRSLCGIGATPRIEDKFDRFMFYNIMKYIKSSYMYKNRSFEVEFLIGQRHSKIINK